MLIPVNRVDPRILSPSQIIAEDDGANTKLINIVSEKKNWLVKKEFLNLYNVVWLVIGIALAAGIVVTAVTITVVRCRQANADVAATTVQAGRYVSETCSTSYQCIENAQCVNSQCECVADFFYDTNIGQCVMLKTYGLPCVSSLECNSNYGLCIRERMVGEICLSTADCIPGSYCGYTGADYRCLCPAGYYVDSNQGQYTYGTCTLQKQFGERCSYYYNECALNLMCTWNNIFDGNAFCKCRSDYYFSGSTTGCVAKGTYGSACVNTTQCLNVNLLCLSSVCACNGTQYWNGTWCVDYLLYSQACSSSSQCNPLDSNLVCGIPPEGGTQSVCYCQTGTYFEEYYSKCITQKYPTINCTDTSQCITNAVCLQETTWGITNDLVCTCVPGYYYNTVTGACTAMASYGASCASAPCNNLLNLFCYTAGGTCSCPPDYYWNGAQCELSAVYGEACSTAYANYCRASRNLACSTVTSLCYCPAATPTYDAITTMCH